MWLKQSTAVTIKIGPFVDEADGYNAETGLTISQGDVRLSKNGGDIAQKNEASACTHDEIGIYDCAIDATDTGTLGRLDVFVHESGARPVRYNFMVVPSNVWDSMFGADKLQVHADEITAGLITATAIADNAITAAKINADTITADKIADNAIGADQIAANAIVAAKIATGAITSAKFAAGAINADALAADCITEAKIADNAIAAEHIAAAAIDFATFAADCKTGSGLKANVESITAAAITATAIADNAITAAKIADDAITQAKVSETIQVDVTEWLGSACATPTVAGVPEVDLTHIAGAAVSTTTAQLGVNVEKWNNSSVPDGDPFLV